MPGEIRLKGANSTADPRLDRVPQFDEESRKYAVRSILPTVAMPTTAKVWRVYRWLDQGQEGACVGFSRANEINTLPCRYSLNNDYARAIYKAAQKIDQWPGENYEGTSVIAGAKIALKLGFMLEYRWAFSTIEVAASIVQTGPGVAGIAWYNGMFDAHAENNFLVKPEGGVAGGHAIMVRGFYPANARIWSATKQAYMKFAFPVFRFRNSWGKDWGDNGDCYISFEDTNDLLQDDGEFCISVGQQVLDPVPPAP